MENLKVSGSRMQLWRLQIPPKIKHFIWRLVRGCLPSRQRLQSKKVFHALTCCFCISNPENEWHIFFGRDQVKSVWIAAGMQNLINGKMQNAEGIFGVFGVVEITRFERIIKYNLRYLFPQPCNIFSSVSCMIHVNSTMMKPCSRKTTSSRLGTNHELDK